MAKANKFVPLMPWQVILHPACGERIETAIKRTIELGLHGLFFNDRFVGRKDDDTFQTMFDRYFENRKGAEL